MSYFIGPHKRHSNMTVDNFILLSTIPSSWNHQTILQWKYLLKIQPFLYMFKMFANKSCQLSIWLWKIACMLAGYDSHQSPPFIQRDKIKNFISFTFSSFLFDFISVFFFTLFLFSGFVSYPCPYLIVFSRCVSVCVCFLTLLLFHSEIYYVYSKYTFYTYFYTFQVYNAI